MSETPEINFLGDLTRLQLKPDDVLVLRTPHPLSSEHVARIREHFATVLGQDTKVLFLGPGFELGVLAPQDG